MCGKAKEGRSVAQPISVTTLLAVYGALLSSITLGWNLYRDLHDRARLRVVARLARIAPADTGTGQLFAVAPHLPVANATEQVFVFVDVTNVGRRPVRWDGWGGKYYTPKNGKKSFIILPIQLPKMLHEGESHTEFTPELVAGIDNVKRIFIWDAAGKKWKLPRRELTKLKTAVQKHLA
jgi:hypothetical protein